jgi:hypothetical protein
MVRESESVAGTLALSVRVPTSFQSDGIAHYIILNTQDGYKIKVTTVKCCDCTEILCLLESRYFELLYLQHLNGLSLF